MKKILKYLKNRYRAFCFNILQDIQIKQIEKENISYPECIEKELKKVKNPPAYLPVDRNHNFLNILLNCEPYSCGTDIKTKDDTLICWEIRPTKWYLNILKYAKETNKKVLFIGDSFLRSINTFAQKDANPKYQKGISFTVDDLTAYFDVTKASRLELLLNDSSFVVAKAQKQRAKMCIDKIVSSHLTKYNHQPIYTPDIGTQGAKKVLVVDQSYGDMSIKKGLSNTATFENMLKCAIKENPDADIIVKTHPDTIAGRGGYYTSFGAQGNIYKMVEPINPISLIKYVDKVYVCTTQLGFEALMCGKETHTFGMPFYAGWGLTCDRKTCKRRTNKRSIEEVFYIAYIVYSRYVNPNTNSPCEIEDAIDYLLSLRDEYFNL